MIDDKLDAMIDEEWRGWSYSTSDLEDRIAPDPAELGRLTSLATSEAPKFDPKAMGLGDLTHADWNALEARAQSSRGTDEAGFDWDNVPLLGAGVEVARLLEGQLDAFAVQSGTATREQQLAYAMRKVDEQRPSTFWGGFQDMGADVVTLGSEMALSVAGGAGAAAIGTRAAAKAGVVLGAKATSTMLLRRTTELGLLTAAREGLPRLAGAEGGAWTANSIRRALPDLKFTDEEAEHLAAIGEADFAATYLGRVFDENPIYRGMAEDLMELTLERTVGPGFSKLTTNAALKGIQGRVYQKLGADVDSAMGLAAKLRDKVAVDGALSEVVEEIVQGMAVEGTFGENALDGLPDSWHQVAQIAMLGSVPGGVAAGISTIQNRQRAAAKTERLAGTPVTIDGAAGTIRDVSPDGEVAVDFEDGSQGFFPEARIREATSGAQPSGEARKETSTGGEASAGGEATAATAGVEAPVSTVEPEAVQRFAEQAQIKDATPVAPRNEAEAEAVQMASNLGREIVLVSGEGGQRASGMIDDQGRMFVHAETASPLGVALHEMGHDLADKLGEDAFRAELAQIEKIAPGLVARYRDQWLRRREAAQGDAGPNGQRFASDQGLAQEEVSAELATEEGFSALAEEYAAMISYASTRQGATDMRTVASHSPTIFSKIVDTVRRFARLFKPDSHLGALDRIQKATRSRPDQAGAQLSLYLANLYKRGFGVDTRAPEGDAGPAPSGGSLLEQLQAEAAARGLPVVKPEQAQEASASAGLPATADPNSSTESAGTESGVSTEAQRSTDKGQSTTTEAVPVGEPSAATDPGSVHRPDLSNPLPDAETRAVMNEADRVRNAQGLPEPRTRKEAEAHAKVELQRDYDGTRFEIEAKLETGELLSEWETHALIDIIKGQSLQGLAGNRDAFKDALRLSEAYRAVRSETSRALSTVAGRGRSAQDAVIDMMTMATRSNRRKRAKIQAEVDGIMRLVSPFKSQRARYLRTRHQMEQERKGDRFAPNRELKFAPGLLDEQGRHVTEARLEYLQNQLEKIENDEAARMEKAGEAVRNLGFDLDALTMEEIIDPYDGWRIKNAISTAKATKTDKFLELRYMNMLSGLATHARNTSGNATMLIVDGPILKTAEAVANLALKATDKVTGSSFADTEGATATEIASWFKGFAASMRPAFRNMLNAYRTQGPTYEMEAQAAGVEMGVYAHDFGTKLDFVPGPKIGGDGVLGKAATVQRHLSLNTLLASDEYFKTVAGTAEVHSLAFRQASLEGLKGKERDARMAELLADRGSNIWTQALYKAREITFQDDGGKVAQGASKVLNNIVGTLDDLGETYLKTPIGTILIPFRKTPVRIAARALRLTPLQTAMLPARAIAGEYSGNRGALVRDLADAMMAWGLTLTVMQLVDMEDDDGRPFITGPRSTSRAESSLDYATAPPMSIRVDGAYYDYGRFEPAATGLGMLVALGEQFKETGDAETLSSFLQAAVAQTKDKTFLRTIGDLMELADASRGGKDRVAAFARDTLVTPMVPNIIRQTARESDDVLRERRKSEDGTAAFWLDGIFPTAADSIARMTGAEAKQVRYDAWGQAIKRPFAKKGGTDTIFRLLSPIQPRLDTKDTSKLDLALLAWERKVSSGEVEDAKVYYPGRPSSSFKIDGEDYTMTPSEYSGYVRDSGRAAAKEILSSSRINLDDPGEDDIERIRKAVNKARRDARGEIIEQRKRLAQP